MIVCLMGPTASGKTALAVELIKALPMEIISVDSAMVYKGMDIGTAKPSLALLKQAPHRLINLRDPATPYSTADFCQDASLAIQEIQQKNKIPLLVGGTLLYFHALQQGLSDLPKADPQIRDRLFVEAKAIGWPALYERLKKNDPKTARRLHPNDSQRIQRALEVYEITGKPLSILYQTPMLFKHTDFCNIIIAPQDRKILHERIEKRFHHLLEQGFIAEVTALFKRPDLTIDTPAMRAVGYRQVWQYLNNQFTYEEMIERAVIATRQLAKRQLTWLRHWPESQWFDSEASDLKETVLTVLCEKCNCSRYLSKTSISSDARQDEAKN